VNRLSIRLLSTFEVVVDGEPVPEDAWRPRRGADLVKLLALSDGHRLHRERAVDALWPRLAPEAGLANLHKAAHLARRAIGDKRAVVLQAGLVMLAPEAEVETDVERFEAAADPELYGGELLPDDRYEEWASEPRRRLRARRLELLRAAGRLEELVREDPADEAAQCAVAETLAASGRRHAALRQLQRLRDALAGLGLSPGPDAEALAERLSRGAPAVAPVATDRPITGRERELHVVRTAVDRLAAGRGGALLVTGEAGIGKTRVCEELLAIASRAGMTTLRGAAQAVEATVPYGPVTDALDALLRERPDLAAGLTEGARAELARLSVAAPGSAPEPSAFAPDRQRIFSAVGQLLAAAARERGAVILIDDLQVAAGATRQLAGFLARAAAFQPLLVVLAFDDRAAPAPLAALRSSLLERRAAAELRLGPLGRRATDALVAQVRGAPQPPAVCDEIWRLASGNPFFTEELAAAIDRHGRLHVPGRLYEVVNARIARIEPSVRHALTRLAVTGDELTIDLVCVLTGLGEDAALLTIDKGLAHGLLRESGDRIGFRHGLLRQALVRTLPAHRLAAEHRAVAEELERAGAPAARVAAHLRKGQRPADAVAWYVRAAREAAAVAAYGDALDLLGAALEDASPRERDELAALRADLLLATGDRSAPAAYSRAVAAAAPERAVELRAKQSRALLLAGDVEGAMAAVEGARASTPGDAAQLATVRALTTWFRGDLDEARRQADSARSLAMAQGLDELIVESTALRAAVAHTAGEWPARVRYELADTLARPAVAQTVFDALHCTAEYALTAGGPYEPLTRATEELRATAERSGARRAEAFATTVIGEARLLAGDVAQAEADLRQAVELNERVGAVCGQAVAHCRLGQASAAAGRSQEAAGLLEAALAHARWSPLANHLLYLVYEARLRTASDAGEAVALLDREQASLEQHRACPFCAAGFQAAAAIACAEAGEIGRAAGFLQVAEAAIAFWRGGPHAAAVSEAGGALAAAEGATEVAAGCLHRAAGAFAAAGQRLNEARVRARLEAVVDGSRGRGKVPGRPPA
jgi:DNA-binding SARP family transcriptional activator/tetratricopeptide (TPR) repeat protein